MSVKVISPLFDRYNEQQTLTATGRTIGECLKQLVRQYPALGKRFFNKGEELNDFLWVYRNKEATPAEGVLDLPVENGDEVHVIVLISGG